MFCVMLCFKSLEQREGAARVKRLDAELTSILTHSPTSDGHRVLVGCHVHHQHSDLNPACK